MTNDEMSLDEYLAHGGKLTSPGNVPQPGGNDQPNTPMFVLLRLRRGGWACAGTVGQH